MYSETVRCRSHSALKISHLRSITACFIPRSLSENSKWCSKPFRRCGTNHMLPFILDVLHFFPPFCSGAADKSNSETLNCPGFLCITCWTGFFRLRPREVFLFMSLQSAADGLLNGCHAETCQACLGFHPRSTNTATQVYSKISVFAHVRALALSQKQTVSLSSACECAC